MYKKLKYKYHSNNELPENDNEYIIVFGSNERGAHGRGMALIAKERYGAVYGEYVGLTGRCYAIPTKDKYIRTLSLKNIQQYIGIFKELTHNRPELKFYVTGIGTGLAGYKHRDIAPFFRGCNTNCNFPIQWKQFIE